MRLRDRETFEPCARPPHHSPEVPPAPAAPSCEPPRQRPKGWAQTFPANRQHSAARPAKSQREAPTRPACGNRARRGQYRDLKCCLKRVVGALVVEGGSIKQAVCDGRVTVDAAVAQERPVPPNVLERLQIDFADQKFLAIVRSLGQRAPERIGEKRAS